MACLETSRRSSVAFLLGLGDLDGSLEWRQLREVVEVDGLLLLRATISLIHLPSELNKFGLLRAEVHADGLRFLSRVVSRSMIVPAVDVAALDVVVFGAVANVQANRALRHIPVDRLEPLPLDDVVERTDALQFLQGRGTIGKVNQRKLVAVPLVGVVAPDFENLRRLETRFLQLCLQFADLHVIQAPKDRLEGVLSASMSWVKYSISLMFRNASTAR